MNQTQPAAKRCNLYTLSLFALKLWLFIEKYKLKLGKRTFKNLDKFFLALAVQASPPQTAELYLKRPGVLPGLANVRPPGRTKLAKAPPPGLTRWANAP